MFLKGHTRNHHRNDRLLRRGGDVCSLRALLSTTFATRGESAALASRAILLETEAEAGQKVVKAWAAAF